SSGPRTAPPAPPPPAPPARSAAPPPPAATPPAPAPIGRPTPPPLSAVEVEDDALLEEAHYENEGGDFAMSFRPESEVDEAAPTGSASSLGKHVLVPPRDPCGQCDVCRRGGAAVCAHARAREPGRRVRASSRWLIALADGLELPLPHAAAVAGDVATAYT